MSNKTKILELGALYEFKESPREGFIGMSRRAGGPDGFYEQRLDVFRWHNDAVAETSGIPRAYLVLCLTLHGSQEDGGRWRLPLVEWPSEEQPLRTWDDVVSEFDDVFAPLFDVHERLGSRYRLGRSS